MYIPGKRWSIDRSISGQIGIGSNVNQTIVKEIVASPPTTSDTDLDGLPKSLTRMEPNVTIVPSSWPGDRVLRMQVEESPHSIELGAG